MRLNDEQIDSIHACVAEHLGASARLWLFGSRLDDSSKGGDVDLYVEAPTCELMQEVRCKMALEAKLDLAVDLIVRKPGDTSVIARIAKAEGRVL